MFYGCQLLQSECLHVKAVTLNVSETKPLVVEVFVGRHDVIGNLRSEEELSHLQHCENL